MNTMSSWRIVLEQDGVLTTSLNGSRSSLVFELRIADFF